MEDKFAKMGKAELRAACKAAGIAYGNLNNDGMRNALRAKEAPPAGDNFEAPESELSAQAGRPSVEKAKAAKENTEELKPDPVTDASTGITDIAPAPIKGSGGKPKGKGASKPAKQGDRHTGEGLKIEKDREEKNGVKRPSAGGKCREVWDYLDDVYNGDGSGTEGSDGVMPTAQMVRDASGQMGWNPNNASIEFYQWRKFMGIKGRTATPKK